VNPMQLISSQTDVRRERYHNLFIKSNRQKNLMLTVQSVQFVHADMAESYDHTCGDVEVNYCMTYGQVGSRHVAPRYWLIIICKMY
jgi:hypothetical protein